MTLAARSMTHEDPVLGVERLCPRCGEWWPLDPAFWYFHDGKLTKPRWCRACRCEYNQQRKVAT